VANRILIEDDGPARVATPEAVPRLRSPWPADSADQIEIIHGELVRQRQLERLLPADVVGQVVRTGALPPTGDRRILTIMFFDIRDYSRIQETLSPEQTIEFLNINLGLAAQAILANKGSVVKFIGDGILALFGLLNEPDHGATDALAAAGAIHCAFESASPLGSSTGPIRAIVAIHTGTALVGVVGLAERADYAVLGSAVNVASRLESAGKELNLRTVVSGSTVASLTNLPPSLHLVTRRMLRGVSDRLEIWSIDPAPAPDLAATYSSGSARAESIGTGGLMGSSSSRRRSRKAFATAVVAAAIFAATFAAVVGLRLGGLHLVIAFDDLAKVTVALITSAACAWTASRSHGRIRGGWALIGASAAAWGLGQATWTVYELGLGIAAQTPSLADAGFLASLPLGIAGVLWFWTSPVGTSERWRAWLDGLIVIDSLTFAAFALGLKQVYLSPEGSLAERAFQLAYPLGGILIGTALIMVINRGARHQQGQMLILLGGLAVGAIAYVIAAAPDVDSFGTIRAVADGGAVGAFLLIALAPLWPAPSTVVAESSRVDMWQLALPWMAVLLTALITLVLVLQNHSLEPSLALLIAILAALLAVSQILAHKDSASLLALSRLHQTTLANIVAHAPIGMARADLDFNVIDANPSLGAMLREPIEALIGSTITKYFPAETQPQVREKLAAVVSGTTDTIDAETQMIRADGSRAWVHVTATAVNNSSGKIDYVLAMLQDVTTRHETEEAARASLAGLEQLNEVKTKFLQSVVHEFKTAVIGIQGFSELIRDAKDLDADEVHEFAGDIFNSAQRLDRMVTEIQEIDGIEVGRRNIRLESVDVNAMIRREVEETKTGTDGLTFTMKLEPGLTTVAGDEAKLSQVVSTLLRDATKNSPDGGQVIIVSRTHVGQVEVSVKDQGLGARAEFDNPLFGQDDLYANNPIRRVVGTSLGLGIARQIVALHGGRMWVDRLEGIGSEFHFTVPVSLARAELMNAGSATSRGRLLATS